MRPGGRIQGFDGAKSMTGLPNIAESNLDISGSPRETTGQFLPKVGRVRPQRSQTAGGYGRRYYTMAKRNQKSAHGH